MFIFPTTGIKEKKTHQGVYLPKKWCQSLWWLSKFLLQLEQEWG